MYDGGKGRGRRSIFTASIRLGRIFGIPIGLHYTWFIVFVLVTGLLARSRFPNMFDNKFDDWSQLQYWGVAIATSLLFFASILAHELGHSVVALRYGIQVKSITLFVFGGVARIARDAPRPGIEALIALAGPAVSLALGGISLGIYFLFRDSVDSIEAMSWWLGTINIAVALFNLIPGFPLDGGRVFRAVVWGIGGNFVKATRVSSLVGRTVGYLFIISGLLLGFWTRDIFNGLWLAFIGWFLESAASQSYTQVALREALKGIHVREMMTRDVPIVPRRLDLRTLVDSHIFFTGRRFFLVGENGSWDGLVSLQDIKNVPQGKWSDTRVGDIMVPASRVATVSPDDEALQAMEIMDETDVNQVPVKENGAVVGLVGRDNIIRFLRTRTELQVST